MGELAKIVKYVHKGNKKTGPLVGVLVAVEDYGNEGGLNYRIGFALCNTKSGDVFSKERGVEIATGRAFRTKTMPIPFTIVKEIYKFQDRCDKYFKDRV